jgi:hypothetical protein
MSLNEVTNIRELQLHGIINGLTKDLENTRNQNAEFKLRQDGIVDRAEMAERELRDRDESIYELTLKLISCEAQLLTLSQRQSNDMQLLELTEKYDLQSQQIQKLKFLLNSRERELKVLRTCGDTQIQKFKLLGT